MRRFILAYDYRHMDDETSGPPGHSRLYCVQMDNEHLANLIEELGNSLHRGLQGLEDRLSSMDRRLEEIAKTQKRHSALFTADALAVRRRERTVMQHDEAIFDLNERLRKLEGGLPN